MECKKNNPSGPPSWLGDLLARITPPYLLSGTVTDGMYDTCKGFNGSGNQLYVFGDRSMCDCESVSPLTLDLNGNGVETGAGTFFDHGSDGWAEVSLWSDEGDGVLVWDRNGDGVINDGSDLFGDNTVLANGENAAHGFAALSDLDSNGDGVVDAQDENFADLRVMRRADEGGYWRRAKIAFYDKTAACAGMRAEHAGI